MELLVLLFFVLAIAAVFLTGWVMVMAFVAAKALFFGNDIKEALRPFKEEW